MEADEGGQSLPRTDLQQHPLGIGEKLTDAVVETHRLAQMARPITRIGRLLRGDPGAETSGFSAMPDITPVFEGAVTSNPTSMMDATMPGQEESITFVADAAGEYAMVCYIPGHAATGMYIYFNVSAEGEAGVQGPM